MNRKLFLLVIEPTEAQDLSPPDRHFRLATRGRSIQMGHFRTYTVCHRAVADRARALAIASWGLAKTDR